MLQNCVNDIQSYDSKLHICVSCSNSIKKSKLPDISVANSLEVEERPDVLKNLKPLECIFISKRIPFMKIVGLPRGKQPAIHGTVVNVPINPEECVGILP